MSESPSRRERRLVQGFALVVLVATGVAFVLPLDEELTATASGIGTFLTGPLMVLALAHAVRANKGIQRFPWLATLGVYAVGMVVYALDPIEAGAATGEYPVAMAFGPFATAAQIGVVAVLSWQLLSELRIARVLLDSLWLGGSALLVGWSIAGQPIVVASGLSAVTKTVLLTQLVLFAALIGFLVAVLPHADRAGRWALVVLASPAVLIATALVYQARVLTEAGLERGTLSDFLFPLAFGIGASAVVESRLSSRVRIGEDPSTVRPLLVAGLPLAAWILTIALGEFSLIPSTHFLGLGVGAVALVRVTSLANENTRLIRDLRFRADHDHLTGLPNRAGLENILDGLRDGSVALLLVDLDRFKRVNDTLGHHAGDALLSEASRRMVLVAGESWSVTRLAGDEFVIVGPDGGGDEVEGLGRAVIDSLAQPFLIGDRQAWVGATVGIATTRDGLECSELVDAADNALRRAKADSPGDVLRVGIEHRDEAVERRELEAALRAGIGRDELFCVYQPKVDLDSGRMVGVEALVRWDRPGYGVVAPSGFIDVAESSGLIAQVDEWVFDDATRQLELWNALDPSRRLSLSVNMSAWQLSRLDVHETVGRAIARRSGVDPDQVTVEITETALIEAPAVVASRLCRLRELGVRLSIDDFGVGFTAIAYLVDFPVEEVKIDRTLVALLTGGPDDDRSLAGAVIALARAMELEVIAEGVETEAQVGALRRLGCGRAQGYHFSAPVRASAIERLIVEQASFDLGRSNRSHA